MSNGVRDLLRWKGTLPRTDASPGVKGKAEARKEIAAIALELTDLQEKLYANGKLGAKERVLLLLQGLDASGKDGTVKHVVGLVNPRGCAITGFGKPTKEELAHDFLWRITNAVPAPGMLGVFNRSQYEDVLVVRVEELVPRATWSRRYARINAWEKRMAAEGVSFVKVFLHLGYEEQCERLLTRIDDPTKQWKVGPDDNRVRSKWDDYQQAYRDALDKCDEIPWYVVPADRKWYRDWAVSHLLLETLRDLEQDWPTPPGVDLRALRQELLGSSG
jgi:PPK2 family polyphosphate:nucleotide phosphotransferase